MEEHVYKAGFIQQKILYSMWSFSVHGVLLLIPAKRYAAGGGLRPGPSLLGSGATTRTSKVSVLTNPSSRHGGVPTWVHPLGLQFASWETVVDSLPSSVLLSFVFHVTAHGYDDSQIQECLVN